MPCPQSRLAGKSKRLQPSTFLFGGVCRRPSLKHAGARHNAFAASFAVNRFQSNKPLSTYRLRHSQHVV